VVPGKPGPAPLRRLSDTEYLNALRDLFPVHNLTLPKIPADALVAGFENAAESQQPSDVRIARYETIANLYAEANTADRAAVAALVGCSEWSLPSVAADCATQFIERMGQRIFRRPLDSDELDRFIVRFQSWQATNDFESAVRLNLSALQQSPQFLYNAEPIPADSTPGSVLAVEADAMASRLSFLLWESIPDDKLLAAVSSGHLRTAEEIAGQAGRMLRDDRARRVFWNFHRQWLGLDRIADEEHLVRTEQVDPLWTSATQSSILRESQLFVENTLADGGSLADLLTSRRAWIDGQMARLYGTAMPDTPWSELLLPQAQRAGLLTRAAFLAGLSHRGGTSPPLRGNGLRVRFLCQVMPPPPQDANLSMPSAEPGEGLQTNRVLFERRTSPTTCQGCHRVLDGFGFGFENYTAAGMYQSTEQGLPIDATGAIMGTDVDRAYDGAVDLSLALSQSRTVFQCSAEQWLRYALGRAPTDDERPTVEALADAFMARKGDVHDLLMNIATSPSFRFRVVEENEGN
jgi:hypothetical protein